MTRLLGWDPEELIGTLTTSLVAPGLHRPTLIRAGLSTARCRLRDISELKESETRYRGLTDEHLLEYSKAEQVELTALSKSRPRPADPDTGTYTGDSSAEIAIADNGIGIAEPHQGSVFTAFKQVKPGVGLGLGLAIVSRIVETADGAISVSSDGTSGSIFTLTLPAA